VTPVRFRSAPPVARWRETGARAAVNRRQICGSPSYRSRALVAILEATTDRDQRELMSLDLQALETSFDIVAPRGDELMDEFYKRLFEAAPAVMPLFAGSDLKRQKTMLLGTLVLLRKSLRDLDAIVPKLRELGARHVAYGAQPEHYPVVGEVLIAAMATIAGPAWRPEHERAWGEAFGVVAGAMLEGADAAALEAAA
jgi:hemoglobin-like flavoprotein